nr:UDP-phosphate galactose phosphotransferase [Klebsiella pneumoniae]
MSRLARNFWCSIALALSDFVGFTIAMYIAIATVKICLTNGEVLVINSHIDDWMAFHVCLGLCCVAWYSIRLRHYFYRKTFWFELKEILRTLVIFAVIEIAVMSFASWYFSR